MLGNGQSYMIQKKVRMGNLKKGAKVTFAQRRTNMVDKVTMEKKS